MRGAMFIVLLRDEKHRFPPFIEKIPIIWIERSIIHLSMTLYGLIYYTLVTLSKNSYDRIRKKAGLGINRSQ